jgi:hypothetical protein
MLLLPKYALHYIPPVTIHIHHLSLCPHGPARPQGMQCALQVYLNLDDGLLVVTAEIECTTHFDRHALHPTATITEFTFGVCFGGGNF